MRLFVAIDLPSAARRAVQERVAAVRDTLPEARWLGSEALHLTLVFLGERDPGIVSRLDRALAPLFAASPRLRLRPCGSGAFPPRGAPRVLWIGFDPDDDLLALQKAVVRAAAAVVGEPPEGREYRPHLTVARVKRRWRAGARRQWLAAIGKADLAAVEAAAGVLVESRLAATGASYRRVTEYPLEVAA